MKRKRKRAVGSSVVWRRTPQYLACLAERGPEIAAAKAVLWAAHRLRAVGVRPS